jgi:putative transposase
MITRKLKLKLNTADSAKAEGLLFQLTGAVNWALRKLEQDAEGGVFHRYEDLANLTSGQAKKSGIHSQVFQQALKQAVRAWDDHKFNGKGKPRLKGNRNKLNSFVFPQACHRNGDKHIKVPAFGVLRTHKQSIPEGRIKQCRFLKKPSGWYAVLTLDCGREPILVTDRQVNGADPGFNTLLTLSNGVKAEHPKELQRSLAQLGRLQRSKAKKKTARLHERIANQRLDRNHKLSLDLVRTHEVLYISKDNHQAVAKRFGKSAASSAHGQLKQLINYKSSSCGRLMVEVPSKYSTQTCSACGALTGPKGLGGLKVRNWTCSCGATHDRDVNAAINALIAGLARHAPSSSGVGMTLDSLEASAFRSR